MKKLKRNSFLFNHYVFHIKCYYLKCHIGSFSIKTQYKIYIIFSILSARKKFSANTLLGGWYCYSESLAGAN